jgi:hypothetical protein
VRPRKRMARRSVGVAEGTGDRGLLLGGESGPHLLARLHQVRGEGHAGRQAPRHGCADLPHEATAPFDLLTGTLLVSLRSRSGRLRFSLSAALLLIFNDSCTYNRQGPTATSPATQLPELTSVEIGNELNVTGLAGGWGGWVCPEPVQACSSCSQHWLAIRRPAATARLHEGTGPCPP